MKHRKTPQASKKQAYKKFDVLVENRWVGIVHAKTLKDAYGRADVLLKSVIRRKGEILRVIPIKEDADL